jgi:predicted nucleotide-binding protein (sugar kinase/HSP70/actin superfamily)
VEEVLSEGRQHLEGELAKIEQFYAQFYAIIDEHKRRVTEEAKGEFQKVSEKTEATKAAVESALLNAANMREDIHASVNSVIL